MTWFFLGGSTHGEAAENSAELLARLRMITNRPANDRHLTNANGFLHLTDAQTALVYRLAAHLPDLMMGPLEKMTAGADGLTYTTKQDILGHAEFYPDTLTGRSPLTEGPRWDLGADYTREGPRTIRLIRLRTFPDGAPYARYVQKPGVIDDTNQPALQPADVRRVLPWMAAASWAETGGTYDPSPYLRQVERLLWGDPNSAGDLGIIPSYKLQHFAGGGVQAPDSGYWWRSPDLNRLGG